MMTIGFVFWLLMLLWLIFGFVWGLQHWAPSQPFLFPVGNTLLVFILFLLLGVQVFGWPIKG